MADYEFQVNLYGIKMIRLLVCVAAFIFTLEVDFVRALWRIIVFASNVDILQQKYFYFVIFKKKQLSDSQFCCMNIYTIKIINL